MNAAFVDLATLRVAASEWADLCARAEPNPFAEPGFLLPLLDYERPRRLAFALIRGDDGRLIGFAALVLPRVGLARIWMSTYAALPAAAFDREAAPVVLAALCALLAPSRLVGVVWPLVEPHGALAAAQALTPLCAGSTRRAALRLAGAEAFDASLNPKRRTKWARQARKLATLGKMDEATGAQAVAAFFEVERKGWKGARRSAFADDPARLAFAQAALQNFARAGRLDALALRLDGAAIAAGLVLIAGERAFYWKTAYDEAYAETSPGVQLTLAHSRRLAATPGLALVDSCAVEDHPMIGRVWGDTLAFEDWALALRPGADRPLRVWLALARARVALKRWVGQALRRKRS